MKTIEDFFLESSGEMVVTHKKLNDFHVEVNGLDCGTISAPYFIIDGVVSDEKVQSMAELVAENIAGDWSHFEALSKTKFLFSW
jgi:hypothetical protein